MRELVVRAMAHEDLPEIMVNERAAYPIPWSEQVFIESIDGRNDCRVLVDGKTILGHCVTSSILDEFHLLNLCIAPSHSRQGLGRYLLKYLIELAASASSSMFFLEVRASNKIAIELYSSEGFNEVGVRPNYYPVKDGREDAILMTLQLGV